MKLINKETGVVKNIEDLFARDYLATNEWEVVKNDDKKSNKAPSSSK